MTAGELLVDDVLSERAIPAPDPLADFFWDSGADGVLRILRCTSCGYYLHPPTVPCANCLSAEAAPTAVSGAGTVHTFTVNVQQWVPGQQPFLIAVVELAEQEGLRLTTNLLGCAADDVVIGMPVQVRFVHRNGIYYPVFVSAEGGR